MGHIFPCSEYQITSYSKEQNLIRTCHTSLEHTKQPHVVTSVSKYQQLV